MRKITKLFALLLLTMAGFPTNFWAVTYPATAPYGYELVEDASTLQAGDVIIIRQASGNNYLKINNTRTTNASMATNFVLEDAGTGNSSDFYLKAEGTGDYLKAAAASGTMASTTNVSERGVFNIKIASTSGSSPETTIGLGDFMGGDQDHVIRLITGPTGSRIWYNSNGWKYNTGGGHWTGFYAFKKQDNVSGQVATLSYNDIEIYKNGNKVTPGSSYSYNQQVRSTSSPLITVTIGSGDVVYNTSSFTFGNDNKTYTLAIADGYFITAFTINYTTGSGVIFTSNGVTSNDNGALSVTGLCTSSTTFNVSGTSNAWKNYSVMSIEVYYLPKTEVLETGDYYIYNNGAAKYLDGSTNAYAWVNETDLTGDVGLWYIQNLGAGSDGNIRYYVQVKGSNYYLATVGPAAPIGTNKYYLRISVREDGAYYTISGHQDDHPGYGSQNQVGNKKAIQWTGSGNNLNREGGTINNTSFGANAQWVLSRIYTVVVTGTNNASAGVQYNGNTYSDGDSFAASPNVTASDFTPNEVSGYTAYVKMNGTTIVVTYIENIDLTDLYVNNTSVTPTTDPIVEGQWYILSQVRDGETPAYDVGSGSTMQRAATSVTPSSVLTTNTPASDISQYMLRFIPTGIGNGYTIQFATGNFWNDVSTTSSVSSAGSYLVYNATHSDANYTGWAINATSDGTTYGNKVNNNGAGNDLSFWESGQTTTGTNNIWKLYPVELGAHISEVTYNVTITDGTNSKTFSNITSAIGTSITAADYLLSSQYITSDSHEITLADEGQTITLNCAFNNLPFTLSADPSDVSTATYYYMTLSQNYCARNVATASSATFDDDNYLWAFGGSPVTGITVYNKAEGKYMNVASANDSRATFSTTPTFYTIKTNNKETNGFSLNVNETNAYINYRNGYVSTWLSASGLNDKGSCLRVYTETELVAPLLEALAPYFTYAGSVGALTESAAAELNSLYQSFLANTPHSSLYLALKDAIDDNLVELSEGYYIVYSGFDEFTTPKAMYYNTSNNKIAWTTADGSAAQVMKLKAVSGTSNYRIYSPLTDKYLQTKGGATTDAEESGLTLTVTPVSVGKVVLVYNANGGNDAALHTDGHDNGSGTSGNLRGWNITSAASFWRLYPLDIPEITLIAPDEVATGDQVFQSFAYGSNKQLPLNVAVHYISANNGNFAHIETVNSSAIRANEGYIICGVKGATIPLLPIGEVDALSPSNLLVGVVESTTVYSGHMLAYKKGDSEPKFYKIKSSGLTIPAYRSYLPAAAAANVRGLELLFGGIGDDEITGIDGINAGSTEGAIFDLQGRRVTKPEKGGIYIINGKKVMK